MCIRDSGNVYLNGVAPSLDHCEFSFSGQDGVANAGADVTYQSCTFANNPRLGLFTFGDSDVTLNSCISAGNPEATQSNGEEGGSIVANYCDLVGINYWRKLVLNQYDQWVWAWTDTFPPGTGSFSANPLFAYAAGGNFNLSPPSPCINLSLIHISEPTRLLSISYAVFCLKKKKKHKIRDIHKENHSAKKQVKPRHMKTKCTGREL